jgi:hypothetical protein
MMHRKLRMRGKARLLPVAHDAQEKAHDAQRVLAGFILYRFCGKI